jgi:hypothetical protein
MNTDLQRLVDWALEISMYLDEKEVADTLTVYFVHGDAGKKSRKGCRCVIRITLLPTLFVRTVVIPGLKAIHEKYVVSGEAQITALVGNKIGYRLIWPKLPKGAVRYAETFFPAGKQSINTWERNSKYRDMPVGTAPLFYSEKGLKNV